MKSTNDEHLDLIIQACLKFWEIHDYVYHDNKTKIFHGLYLNSAMKDYTVVKQSLLLHVSESTLSRCKRLFTRSIEYLYWHDFTRQVG